MVVIEHKDAHPSPLVERERRIATGCRAHNWDVDPMFAERGGM